MSSNKNGFMVFKFPRAFVLYEMEEMEYLVGGSHSFIYDKDVLWKLGGLSFMILETVLVGLVAINLSSLAVGFCSKFQNEGFHCDKTSILFLLERYKTFIKLV